MNCLCNFFENNECLIWIIIALIVLSSLTNNGCGCCGTEHTGGCGCGLRLWLQLRRQLPTHGRIENNG